MQGVLWCERKQKYVKRRGSYSTVTWTDEMQDALVLTRQGARKAVKAGYWDEDEKRLVHDEFLYIEVCLSETDEQEKIS